MGVHDNYCCICGAPDNNSALDYISNMIDDNDYFLNNNKINIKQFYDDFDALESELTWLSNIILITSENKIVKPVDYIPDDSSYLDEHNNSYDSAQFLWESSNNPANICVVCHVDCYELLRNKLNYTFNFNHICRRLDDRMSVFKNKNIYGTIAKKYSFKQDFKWFETIVKIKNDIMTINKDNIHFLLSPLKSDFNEERILDIWSELYLKFENNTRDSPGLSATLFEPGTILKGNDGENYIITSDKRNINKWSLMNEIK